MILRESVLAAIKARGLDIPTAAERVGESALQLQKVIDGKVEFDESLIVALADELAVPVGAFFSKSAPSLFPIVDFRRATPKVSRVSKGTLKAISFVEKVSHAFSSIGMTFDLDQSAHKVQTGLELKNAVGLAKEWRMKWGLTAAQQLSFGDANKVYKSLRSFIEGLGVAIIHHSFRDGDVSGIYMLVADGPHTIIINTTQSSKARKVFTLAHEFCHFLLRSSGVSNPSVLKNDVERFCNKFAAYLLAPDELISDAMSKFNYSASTENNQIRLFAARLGISQEALLIRLVELKHITHGQYVSWLGQFESSIPDGDQSDGGGGGQSDPIQNKRTEFGSTLISAFKSARQEGVLDELDIYRLSGLKVKFQNQLFDLA